MVVHIDIVTSFDMNYNKLCYVTYLFHFSFRLNIENSKNKRRIYGYLCHRRVQFVMY